ncbi:MAG: hypothetical protein MUO64_04215 [Anaerolineales bacterium]|nr:hypothetical protein [Anaerolineales bacterium]
MFTGPGKPCQPNDPDEIFIRPTRTGDICVLLEPSNQTELKRLRQHQNALQARFGGQPAEVIHLTCQRFAIQREDQLNGLVENLLESRNEVKPFPISAVSLSVLHEEYRDTNILKWCVQVTDDLLRFLVYIENCLLASGILPLQKSWFVPTLVTALVDSSNFDLENRLDGLKFPQYLYYASQFQLSKICAPSEFEILTTIQLLDA